MGEMPSVCRMKLLMVLALFCSLTGCISPDVKAAQEEEMKALGIRDDLSFYKEYVELYGELREQEGTFRLGFDPRLNEIAAMRAEEISLPGGFSHDGIMGYNLSENIAMLSTSYDSPGDLLKLWYESPDHRHNMMAFWYSTGFAKNGRYVVQVFY